MPLVFVLKKKRLLSQQNVNKTSITQKRYRYNRRPIKYYATTVGPQHLDVQLRAAPSDPTDERETLFLNKQFYQQTTNRHTQNSPDNEKTTQISWCTKPARRNHLIGSNTARKLAPGCKPSRT